VLLLPSLFHVPSTSMSVMKCSSCLLFSMFLQLLRLGWNIPLAFFPRSFNIELSTFLKPCVSHLLKVLRYSRLGALLSFGNGMRRKWSEEGRKGEVGRREKNWGRKGGWKILGQGKRMCFWFIPEIVWMASSWTSGCQFTLAIFLEKQVKNKASQTH
jgi:hypothetical protein